MKTLWTALRPDSLWLKQLTQVEWEPKAVEDRTVSVQFTQEVSCDEWHYIVLLNDMLLTDIEGRKSLTRDEAVSSKPLAGFSGEEGAGSGPRYNVNIDYIFPPDSLDTRLGLLDVTESFILSTSHLGLTSHISHIYPLPVLLFQCHSTIIIFKIWNMFWWK